jgi:excinuclease ABC subunit C
LSSQLDQIPGVGPKTRTKLLRHFGSLNKLKNATIPELREIGVSKTVAQTIKLSLK